MLWIAVHLPQLSMESFAATLDAATSQRPLALIEAHRITHIDARAADLGVQPGARRSTALALAADLVLGQADPQRDAQALQAVGYAALAFTPMVCVEATDGAGAPAPVVLLEVQSCLRCFGGFRSLLAGLQQALQPLGHALQIASAPTALGAALLARWRGDLASKCGSATLLDPPGGRAGHGPAQGAFLFGPHSTDPAALRCLLDDAPVWLLGPGREHWEALQGMGLRRLADLRHLPRSGLARRFGDTLLDALDRARGDTPDPREPIVCPPVFEQRIELFTRADNAEQMMTGARVLIARLVAWARVRCSRVAGYTLRLHHEAHRLRDAHASEIHIGLASPSADAEHLASLLAERLARTPLAGPALEMSLRCDALVQAPAPNAELFPTRSAEREGLARLIERLQARLGAAGVQRLALVADHRPERAAVWMPAQAAVPSNAVRPTSAQASDGAPVRPLWLLREPLPLPEKSSRPWLDGTPLQLLAGPERIESGWWDGALEARDYFIARAHDGALVWVFRARLPPLSAPDGAGWYLHGRFA